MNLINLDFQLSLPISRWEHFYEKTWKTPFKNKYFQVGLYKTNSVVGMSVEWSVKQDHAGSALEFNLFGFAVAFVFYDCRHWDYETNTYEVK